MRINLKHEKSLSAWVLRLLIGPAMVVDGLFHIASAGFLVSGLQLEVARLLAKIRIRHIGKSK
jgi:hypothetical protein